MSTIVRFGDIPWHVPISNQRDLAKLPPADADGPGRKFLVEGDGGFYVQTVRMPPGFDAPVHTHDHAEVFMVLAGSCTFNGQPMGPFDVTVVDAGEPYGFVAGADGVQFLVTRKAAAGFSEAG